MGGIAGIGSGINIDDIVKASVTAEAAPKAAQLKRLDDTATAKISALGSLKSALSGFADALSALQSEKLLSACKASVSGGKGVSASAEKNAQAGQYQLEVSELAQSSKIASGAIKGDADTVLNQGGVINIGLGDKSFAINVKAGTTLGQLAEQINHELKDKGIGANWVQDPKSGESRLLLLAKEGGEGNDLTLAVESEDSALKALEDNKKILQKASNARFTIDGLPMESASNEVDGVVKGVRFSLTEVTGKPVTVTIESNHAEVKKALHQFVDSYNKLHQTCAELGRVVPVAGGEPLLGKLVGDSTLRNLQNGLSSTLATAMPGGMRVLSDLGITSEKNGQLKLDDKKLDKALKEHYGEAVAFLNGDNGLMSRLQKSIEVYHEKDGILQKRIDGEQNTRESVKTQLDALNLRMQSVEKNLYAKFIAMDRLVSQMRSASGSLNGLLAGLPGGSSR